MRYQDRVLSNRLCQKEKGICSFSLCTRTFLSHRLHSSCVQWSGSRETDVVSRLKKSRTETKNGVRPTVTDFLLGLQALEECRLPI